MGIVDEDVARVRESADIVQVVNGYTQLKRVGRQWTGRCPFHSEKTPSFSVNGERGVYYCFGCQASGDVITFVREIEHLDFVAAVEWLAAKQGIAVRYTDRSGDEGRKVRSRLLEAVEAAVQWYHQRLLDGRDAGAARRYVRERGLDGETVRRYRIGWAPEEWDALARAIRVPDDVLTEAGLGSVNRWGRQRDFFRARLLFPIFDPQGQAVAFGGRSLPGADGPKYRNTPETRLYAKSKILYGLNWSKEEVVRTNEVIVCEGYTDVIGFARAGLARAVATCGTALTDDHVQLLTRFARRVVLAFDPDAAGQAAAERFYEWERRHEIDVVVADLPVGTDPAELARTDPDRLRDVVERARPFLEFRVDRVLRGAALGTAEGRAKAAEAALAVIAEHPSSLVRDQYVMQVADRCQLDPDRLRPLAAPSRAGRAAPGSASRRPRPAPAVASVPSETELEALRLMVQRPEAMGPLLDPILFADELFLEALAALQRAGEDLHAAMESAGPDVVPLLQRVAVEDTESEPEDVAVLLLQAAARRTLVELEVEMRRADDPFAYTEAISWLKLQVDRLVPGIALDQEEADQLVRWLRRRAEERG
jgi:DNA primase